MKNKKIREGARDVNNVFKKLKSRDFSGTTGEVVKNSTYQLITNLIFKIGSVLFTIIIVRMLGAEISGLYLLALSTIVLFFPFSDLGIGATMSRFVSMSLGRNNPNKAKAYFNELLKYKIYLTSACSLILVLCAYFIANNFYHKPIFYALLAGAIYIPAHSLAAFIITAFQSNNDFRPPLIKEVIFQVLRLIFIPASIFILFKMTLSESSIIGIIIATTGVCHLIGLLYLKTTAKKRIPFIKEDARSLTKKDKQDLKKFMLPMSLTVLSGMFYGNIDTLMLGHYIADASYISYYGIPLGLIGSLGAVIHFVPAVMLPTFSRIKKGSLNRIFSKVRNFTLLIGIMASVFVFFTAKYILILYGSDFAQATIFLQIFSLMLILSPMASLYEAYFISIKKTKIIAVLLIISTIVNIILNIIFIRYGLQFGMMQAAIGACIATIISKIVYLYGLIIFKKRYTIQGKCLP